MRALTWPRLIGITVGLIGLGGLLSTFVRHLPLALFTDSWPLGLESWFAVGISVLGLALSYPLFSAHDWARRVLFVISLLICLGFAIIFSAAVIRRPNIAYDGAESAFTPEVVAEIRREELVARLSKAGDALWPLTLSTFLTLVLIHPDVVRAFRRSQS
jgi:hypothetical protein